MASELLTSELVVPRTPEAASPFFAGAGNLERITPPWLRFRVLTRGPNEMLPGAPIDRRATADS